MGENDFDGKTALVTGATSGIGKAVALRLAAGGAHVLVAGRDKQRGDAVVSTVRQSGGDADFVSGELNDTGSAHEFAGRAIDAGGGVLDILINNTGHRFVRTDRGL